MSSRQLVAVVLAVTLIGGAWLIRTQVIDGDDEGGSGSPSTASTVVCVTELQDICRSVRDARSDVTVRIELANTTLDSRGSEAEPSDEIWITMQPFPEMVERLLERTGIVLDSATVEPIASSPLSLVVAAGRAESLKIRCGDPVDWGCLGDNAGREWTELGPTAENGKVRPAFGSHPSTAIGQLGVTSAVLGFFGDVAIDRDDLAFSSWARRLSNAPATQPGVGASAVAFMQSRPSAFDIAVGAKAELVVIPDQEPFEVLPTDPAMSVDVVAVVPAETKAPDGLIADLEEAFVAAGWDRSQGGTTTASADDMLLVRSLWEELVQ